MKLFIGLLSALLFLISTNIIAEEDTSNEQPGIVVVPAEEERVPDAAPPKNTAVLGRDGEVRNTKSEEYYRFFGEISLRANERFVYIKAGKTTIIADANGQVQISAGGPLIISTQENLSLSAGKDITLKAGGKVITRAAGN